MQAKSNMWVWIVLLLVAIGSAVYFFVLPKMKPKTNPANPTKPDNTGNPNPTTTTHNTGGGGGNTANLPVKVVTANLNWGTNLKSLSIKFSPEGLIAQSILRYKGIKGKNGKDLTLDGKVGQNTQFAIKALFSPTDVDDQDLTDLFNKSGVDIATVLVNQKNNVESGTNNKYTV